MFWGMQVIKTLNYSLCIGDNEKLITYRNKISEHALCGPVFEVDGMLLQPLFSKVELISQRRLNEELVEYQVDGIYEKHPDITLSILLRVSDCTPVLKFRYILKGNGTSCLTKTAGEKLDYCSWKLHDDEYLTEVRLSDFNAMFHSFCMTELPVRASSFTNQLELMGPILAGTNGTESYLMAYEHGSQYPDMFISYRLTKEREVFLSAKKGNYTDGTLLTEDAFETIWMEYAAIEGDIDDMAAAFREFQLRYATLNRESRKPYIFYNTWNYQERNKWWNQKTYLESMHEARMLEEIDIAHEIGIDVFVLDTGWYEKTGDWIVNYNRFADGMKRVKAKLDSYGMKLGLWIGPTLAAVTSNAHKKHANCKCEWNGRIPNPAPVWETEESYGMCIVSPYWETLADTLIGLSKELGVTYFKWDAISQYGCNSPNHYHGNAVNTPEERAHSYAFQVGIYMEKIVNKVCKECPDVIVDFDITEGGRSVGLGFLSVGKYFLINNGPYYQNYNIPYNWETEWSNIFVHPGAPRTWICRMPLTYDKWIPSVLFLTHYLPDDPIQSQDLNMASLILGQNGIWGDLPKISKEGRSRMAEILSKYKKVRDDITAEAAIKSGQTGAGFECYEKISSKTGKGVVCVFSGGNYTYKYVTEKKTSGEVWASIPANVTRLEDGTSLVEISFSEPGAAIIFFGV